MSLVSDNAPQASETMTPRRVAVAAGALGLATLFGMALGSLPALTRGTDQTPSHKTATAAAPGGEMTAEDQARQAALQQLARAMLKKQLADQAAALKNAAPQENVAVTTAGANASAALADKAKSAATTQTSGAPPAVIPTPPATEQTARLDPQDMERLAGKAAEAIRNGDIASARLVLEHAVRAGDATALYALAETYDPRVLVKLRVQGMQGEPETARSLYQRALDKGVEEARSRL